MRPIAGRLPTDDPATDTAGARKRRDGPASRDAGHPLGPLPGRAVAALADLGLSETEIARYFGVSRALVRAESVRRGGAIPLETVVGATCCRARRYATVRLTEF